MILMGYSGARGTQIYEKNLKSTTLCQTPFKSLKIRALENYVCLLRHTYTDS
jgi:hypothetical protein